MVGVLIGIATSRGIRADDVVHWRNLLIVYSGVAATIIVCVGVYVWQLNEPVLMARVEPMDEEKVIMAAPPSPDCTSTAITPWCDDPTLMETWHGVTPAPATSPSCPHICFLGYAGEEP